MNNKELVLHFYEEVFNNWDLSRIDDYMLDSYKQHNPDVKDGKAGFIEFAKHFLSQKPHMDIYKIICENDMVVVFFKCTLNSNNSNHKIFDMYRIEDGKLAEHWDCRKGNVQEISPVNGNSVF